jgi:DNA polymerase III gamma/tau subunit
MTTATSLILDTARRGELHHALILHGPSGDLLRDVSVRIAKTLNCLEGTTGDDCVSCLKIDRRTHPDVHFIEAAADRKMISVDQIRELISEASLRPYEGRTKVFVLDPADGLSVGGLNSLLKTLEEPTRDTSFLLLTRSPDLLLPTIRSRSQSIYVGDTEKNLTGPLQAIRIRQVALVREGEELAEQFLSLLHRAARGESAALLGIAAIIGGHDEPKDALALFGELLCDVVALTPSESLDPRKLSEIREAMPRPQLLAAADASLAAIRWLAVNADVRLLAEQVVAELAAGSSTGR